MLDNSDGALSPNPEREPVYSSTSIQERRKRILSRVGGIEETAFVMINGEKIAGRPEEDQDRTTAAGKASSVQFVHFAFSPAQIEAFKKAGAQVIVGLGHENYNHMAVLTEATRAELAKDFD